MSSQRKPGNNFVLVIFDSCRFDALLSAKTPVIRRLGEIEKRWSYASWTAPSHYNLLMGLLPHASPQNVYASEYYKKDFLKFADRLGQEKLEFKSLIPKMNLPSYLKDSLGYKTHAMVSLPVLNPKTLINHGFDSYKLMPKHNDMMAMVNEMKFSEEQPSFYLLNVGETHYPYALPDEPPNLWPRISGVHGVFKRLDEDVTAGDSGEGEGKFFDEKKLAELQHRQIEAVEYLDRVVEALFDKVPEDTWITITADHGELFGEGGYFGHGPIMHEKVFEVPFIEGKLR
ncbi:MAG: sulfatase-like hydrolase/transferase [Bryobacteraceae bacterium]|nr:sulfatase-like hydrolase/transferase [Bryobacteraceae bacterium]